MRVWRAHTSMGPLSLTPYPLPKAAAATYCCCFHYGFPIKSNNRRKVPCAISIRCCASASASKFNNKNKTCQAEPWVDNFVVVNFYRFVFIKDPQHEIAKHLTFLKGLDIHGRIYINEQGINAQYSGPLRDAFAYVEWLKEDENFSDVLVQTSPALNGHAFPKLKLRYKPSLVQLSFAQYSSLVSSLSRSLAYNARFIMIAFSPTLVLSQSAAYAPLVLDSYQLQLIAYSNEISAIYGYLVHVCSI